MPIAADRRPSPSSLAGAHHLAIEPRTARSRRFAWWLLPAGLVVGCVVGAVARGWMRLVTADPGFSWSGTMFIVGGFGSAGLGQALALAARRAAWRRPATTASRVVACVLTLPMYGGAGVTMLPTVLAGALAAWRPYRRWVRATLAGSALIMPALIVRHVAGNPGLDWRSAVGLTLFGATYLSAIAALAAVATPQDDGWRMNGVIKAVTIVAAVAITLLSLAMTFSVATSSVA
jgi:hypothetical protein